MATVTKTYIEDNDTINKATWNITFTANDYTVSEASFTVPLFAPTAKYTYSGKTRAAVQSDYFVYIDGTRVNGLIRYYLPTSGGLISWASGNTKTTERLVRSGDTPTPTANTSTFFNSANKTDKSVSLQYRLNSVGGSSDNSSGTMSNGFYYSAPFDIFSPGLKLILNAPPTVTTGTPTFPTPYASVGAYTVPSINASAQYGGDISKVTLTVGQDSTEQTYSAATISNETISVTPTVAGTFTPTLIVEDSRGQTTVTTFSNIVVNPYLNPSLDFDVFRANSSGVRDDEGAYGLITANVSFTGAISNLTKPTVAINGTTTNNVIWYSSYNSGTGVSGAISNWSGVSSGDTIYGLVNGSFSQTDSYQITVTLTDSLGGSSDPITQTLSTAFYTIDFQAGGKEIAFGGPADDDVTDFNGKDYSDNGLFKCNMGTAFTDMTSQEVSDFVDGLDISGGGLGTFLQHGGVGATTCAANAVTRRSVTFPHAFDSAPHVVVSFRSSSTGATMGQLSCGVDAITASGFDIVIWNSSSTSREPAFEWIAINL